MLIFVGYFEQRLQEERQNARYETLNVIHQEEILWHFNYDYENWKNKCGDASMKMIEHFEVMWACNGSTSDIFTTDREGRPLRHPHSEAISTFLLFFEKLERLSRYANGNHHKKSPCKFIFY